MATSHGPEESGLSLERVAVVVTGAQNGLAEEEEELRREALEFEKELAALDDEFERESPSSGAPESPGSSPRKGRGAHAQELLESLSEKGLGSENSSGSSKRRAYARRVIPVLLEWRELTYGVPVGRWRKRSYRTVLHSCSGSVPPGRLLAVMGPTGCGKTSLLNALAARVPAGGVCEGEVLLNGLPRGRGFKSISAFVMQDDALFHNLTVRETFDFAAAIRLPASVPAEARAALVGQLLQELGLAKVAHTHVGNAYVRGVSGGERKRCSIGVHLLSNPSLLFLDEPTSGLDAHQALNVMETLRALAHSGRTVVATIHQPRSSIYRMFDLLLLLSEGETIYYGHASQAVEWFGVLGFRCPAHYNPADYFLDVIAVDNRSPGREKAARRRIRLLAAAYHKGEQGAGGEHQASSFHPNALDASGERTKAASMLQAPGGAEAGTPSQQALQQLNRHPGHANSLFTEFRLLLGRAWRQQSRDRLPQAISLIQSIVIGLILAALYADMQSSQTGVQDEVGILFFIAIFAAFNALFGALNTFPVDRNVVNRERASKAYRVLPYYCARFICDIPLRIGQALLFGCIVYWIVGLRRSAAAFFIFVSLLILEGLASQGLGVAVSAGCKNEKIAMAIAPAVTVILILFGGFYVNRNTIPAVIRWIEYLSHLYWTFMGLAINDFRGREGWECNGMVASGGKLGPGCLNTGDEILDRLGFGSSQLWEPYLGLSCLIAGYNVLGYFILRRSATRFTPLTHAGGLKQQQAAGGGAGRQASAT